MSFPAPGLAERTSFLAIDSAFAFMSSTRDWSAAEGPGVLSVGPVSSAAAPADIPAAGDADTVDRGVDRAVAEIAGKSGAATSGRTSWLLMMMLLLLLFMF